MRAAAMAIRGASRPADKFNTGYAFLRNLDRKPLVAGWTKY
jgi:hypothetical protein